jgi:hypothetical protein
MCINKYMHIVCGSYVCMCVCVCVCVCVCYLLLPSSENMTFFFPSLDYFTR